MKGATFEERDGSDEKGHGGDEGLHEEDETCG